MKIRSHRFWLINLLLAALWGQVALAAGETPGERKVVETIRTDLGRELTLRALTAHESEPGVYRVDLEADVTGYGEKPREQIRGLVRDLVVHSLAGLGYELHPDSRLKFMQGTAEVGEVRGERPLTVVLFMPESKAPRTVRLSPSAVRDLGKNEMNMAGDEIAAALGVDARSAEILVNTRQVYLRWRRLQASPAERSRRGLPAVVYARWWGRPPPPASEVVRDVKKVDPFAPWWAAVQLWHADMDARVGSGATVGARAKTSANGRLVPDVQIGAGHFWGGFQKFSHRGNLSAPFTFAGAAFPAGSTVTLDLERYQLGGRKSITHHGRNHAEAMAGVDVFVPSGRVASAAAVGRLEGVAYGPIVGLAGNLKLAKHLDLAAGMRLPLAVLGRSEITGFEGEAAIAYRLPGGFEGRGSQLAIGYRLTDLAIRRGDGNTAANAGAIDPSYGGFFLDFRAEF